MKTSYEKFMNSDAVKVELGEIKVDLAKDIDTLVKERDAYSFENAKLGSKAISLLNDVHKIYVGAWPDGKPLLSEFENALKQMQTLGIEPPKSFAYAYLTLKKEIAFNDQMKKQILGKLSDIDSIQSQIDNIF